jgi:FkbM family methyltransferase
MAIIDTPLFVTYAQTFEDLMLHRALKGVINGFYIDVGANHPIHDSVTKVFYEAGWSGINMEPEPEPFTELQRVRSRDVNIQAGVWSSSGHQEFHSISGISALSTFSESQLQELTEAGSTASKSSMKVMDLNSIFEEYVAGKTVHFLKVDVEGAELEVFRGLDLKINRPWIILFEAHGPDPTINTYQPVQDIIIHGGYRYVYCDGVNRYYVANEKYEELKIAFLMPPNCFDNWIRYRDIRFSPAEILRSLGLDPEQFK